MKCSHHNLTYLESSFLFQQSNCTTAQLGGFPSTAAAVHSTHHWGALQCLGRIRRGCVDTLNLLPHSEMIQQVNYQSLPMHDQSNHQIMDFNLGNFPIVREHHHDCHLFDSGKWIELQLCNPNLLPSYFAMDEPCIKLEKQQSG